MFADRLKIISEKIEEASARCPFSNERKARLVAVSKTHPPEAILEALDNGVVLFGENRVQEAKAKIGLLPSRCHWHFIGHLQRNKIRQALPLFELIHGVDSLSIAQDMDRIADQSGLFPKILLEVNVAGEETKFGFTPSVLLSQIEKLLELPRLHIEGLMTIPPPVPKPEDSRKNFIALRQLRDQLREKFHLELPELSMGMSGDFEVAIEEGATLVRIGTALFGERSGKTWKPPESDSLDG
jgi:pyridoxal phosphate enzyme (YggS family)